MLIASGLTVIVSSEHLDDFTRPFTTGTVLDSYWICLTTYTSSTTLFPCSHWKTRFAKPSNALFWRKQAIAQPASTALLPFGSTELDFDVEPLSSASNR